MTRRALSQQFSIGCYTACWGCRFGHCNGAWHTASDADDVWLWEKDGSVGPHPYTIQCGCWCQLYEPKQLIHKGRKP